RHRARQLRAVDAEGRARFYLADARGEVSPRGQHQERQAESGRRSRDARTRYRHCGSEADRRARPSVRNSDLDADDLYATDGAGTCLGERSKRKRTKARPASAPVKATSTAAAQ